MNMRIPVALSLLALSVANGRAQLDVSMSQVKVAGQKAIVPLAIKNNFAEKVESARAVVFLLDSRGKVIGQPTTRWVIGGSEKMPALAAGATNAFNFVVTADKPFPTTNLTAKISFSRVVLEGGRLVDIAKDVVVGTKP
jgi:hypothetical protein